MLEGADVREGSGFREGVGEGVKLLEGRGRGQGGVLEDHVHQSVVAAAAHDAVQPQPIDGAPDRHRVVLRGEEEYPYDHQILYDVQGQLLAVDLPAPRRGDVDRIDSRGQA